MSKKHWSTVPAVGWTLLYPIYGDDAKRPEDIGQTSVIAFAIEIEEREDAEPWIASIPVCADEFSGKWALVEPSGKITMPYVQDFASRDELLAFWREL